MKLCWLLACFAVSANAIDLGAPATVMTGQPVELRASDGRQPIAGVEFRISAPAARAARVTSNSLNVRTGPTTVNAVKAIVYREDRVLVLRQGEDNWCEVIAPAGAVGFASCEFLEQSDYGRPLGVTSSAGVFVSSDVAVVPSDVEVTAIRNGEPVGTVRIRVTPFVFDRTESVAPGISYRERRFVLPEGDGPFTMQILEVDPANPAVDLLPVRARDRAIGRETTSGLARRYGATAAVNAGYFVTTGTYAGASSGVYQFNREILSGGANRTALLLCAEQNNEEHIDFDVVSFRGSVAIGGATFNVLGVNRARGAQDMVVYKAAMGPRTLTDASGFEAIVGADGKVLDVEDGIGSASIPRDGFVLSGAGAAAAWLRQNAKPGSTVTLDLQMTPATPPSQSGCDAIDVVGGGPRLVLDGKVSVSAENFGHENTRNPRTAVAITNNGTLLFVTLDGRQSISAGMRLDEFARELIALGAVKAMNLDGGGSTTMVVRDVIHNRPSDGSERPVSDALLIFSKPTLIELNTLFDKLAEDTTQASPELADTIGGRIKAAYYAQEANDGSKRRSELEAIGDLARAEAGRGLSVAAARLLLESVEVQLR